MASFQKFFSWNAVLRIFQIFLCLSTTWIFVQAEYYKVAFLSNINIGDVSNNLAVSGKTYLFITRHDQNSYTAQLEDSTVSTDGRYPVKATQVSDCSNFKPIVNALRKPFKVFLDESGKLKSIKVNKDDVDLSIDTKFYIASLLQANKQKLQEQTSSKNQFSFTDHALTRLGKCDVTNTGSKLGEQNYDIEYSIKLETCNGFAPPTYADDKQYVDKICRNISETSTLYRYLDDTLHVDFNGKTEFKSFNEESYLSFRPWKNLDEACSSDTKIIFYLNPAPLPLGLEKRKGSSREPEAFNDNDSKEIAEMKYISVDRTLIKEPNNKPFNKELIEYYNALACLPRVKNTILAIVRESIKCG